MANQSTLGPYSVTGTLFIRPGIRLGYVSVESSYGNSAVSVVGLTLLAVRGQVRSPWGAPCIPTRGRNHPVRVERVATSHLKEILHCGPRSTLCRVCIFALSSLHFSIIALLMPTDIIHQPPLTFQLSNCLSCHP